MCYVRLNDLCMAQGSLIGAGWACNHKCTAISAQQSALYSQWSCSPCHSGHWSCPWGNLPVTVEGPDLGPNLCACSLYQCSHHRGHPWGGYHGFYGLWDTGCPAPLCYREEPPPLRLRWPLVLLAPTTQQVSQSLVWHSKDTPLLQLLPLRALHF